MNISTWKDMLSGGSKNTAKVIAQLLHELRSIDDDEYLNQVIRLSARQKDLKQNIVNEEITESKGRVVQNNITKALLFTLDEIGDEGILSNTKATNFEKPTTLSQDQEATQVPSLNDLKKVAKETQQRLFTIQDEKQMTIDPLAQEKIELQIQKTEEELTGLKDQIKQLITSQ